VYPKPSYSWRRQALLRAEQPCPAPTETFRAAAALVGFEEGNVAVDFEEEKLRAYLLLNCLQQVLAESPEDLELLTSEGVVERLLICGTYADPSSLISSQAFRLVREVIYQETADGARFRPLVERYAPEFIWPLAPTPQVIAGLPIFWSCKYPVLPNYETGVPAEQHGAPAVSFRLIGSDEIYTPDLNGRTPLELYNYLLLENPPFSDQMNRSIWQLLRAQAEETREIRNAGPNGMSNTEFQKLLCERDTLFYRFFMTMFKTKEVQPIEVMHGHGTAVKEERERVVVRNMPTMLSKLLPLDISNPLCRTLDETSCPCVNGMVWKLISLLRTDLFQDNEGINWDPDVIPTIDDEVWPHYYGTRNLINRFKAEAQATTGNGLMKFLMVEDPQMVYNASEHAGSKNKRVVVITA
jgi:hypothetical protein